MWRDLRYGIRQLRGKKLFGITIILLLALGIGSNTTIFSFVNSLLLRSLPVRSPENLYLLQKMRTRQVRPDTSFFYRQFEVINREKTIFTGAVGEQDWAGNSFQAFADGDTVQLVTTQIVSPNYFTELGVKAIAGRVLDADDATVFSNIPVVLSYRFWSTQFKRRPDVLGQTIRVKNYPFLVVGVLPSGFHSIEVDRSPDIRFPISAARLLTGSTVTEPGGDYPIRFQILTRLAPGVSSKRAAAAILPVLDEMEETLWRDWYVRSSRPFPKTDVDEQIKWERSYRVALLAAGHGVSHLREQFSHAVLLLMGAVGLLLLAVCVNVAGLLLARSEERKREIAVRLSVGASRWRLLAQLSIENALLAVPGAVLGIGLACGSAPWLLKLLPTLGIGPYSPPVVLDVRPDGRVLFFLIAISLLTVILFGIAPAWRALALDLNEQLKAHSRGSAAASPGTLPVAIQVALAVLLVIAATVMCRTFWNLQHLNPGFDRAHVVELSIDPWDLGYSESQASALLPELKRCVGELPGVRAVSFASMGLMRGLGMKTTIVPTGLTLPAQTFLNTSTNGVTAGYFESLGIPLISGRNLEARDVGRKPTPIVVNRAFAEFFFPHGNPVGKTIVQGVDGTRPPTAIIVGIVGTAKYRSLREQDPPIYYEAADEKAAGGVMYVRTYSDPARLMNSVRGVFRKLAPRLPLGDVFTLEQEVEDSLWQERLVTMLCAFFGMTGLALSATGLYGALAYSVARRSRELGIRIAVGAQAGDIVRTVSARIVLAVAMGLVGGVFAASVLLRFARSLLFGVDPLDPISFVTAAVVLILCSTIAAASPSWRAANTNPNIALRQE